MAKTLPKSKGAKPAPPVVDEYAKFSHTDPPADDDDDAADDPDRTPLADPEAVTTLLGGTDQAPPPTVWPASTSAARTLMHGYSLPENKVREGADPVHVECLNLLEKLVAGGAINQFMEMANLEVLDMIERLKKIVCE